MNSTLYKQLKVYVDDILEKEGYKKRISKHNSRTCIFFITIFIVIIIAVFLCTEMFYIFNTNMTIKQSLVQILNLYKDSAIASYLKDILKYSKDRVIISHVVLLVSLSLFIALLTFAFAFCKVKFHFKKPHFTIDPINKTAIKNEFISKMKLNQEIKKTLNDAFKNADDKNDVKNVLLNDININNDEKSLQINVNLIYPLLTLLITIVLSGIHLALFKIQLMITLIIILICYLTIKNISIDPIIFRDEILGEYIKDYIMNYWLPIHYCRNSR